MALERSTLPPGGRVGCEVTALEVTVLVVVFSSLLFLPPAITQASSLKNYFMLWPVLADTYM